MAFSGRIREVGGKVAPDLVTSPPASALTVVGGRSASESGEGKYGDIFSWKSTRTESIGEEIRSGVYRTSTHAALKGFAATNKPIVFTAGDLEATLIAEHRVGKETSFRAERLSFGEKDDLTLEGKPITLEFNDWISKYSTFAAFEKAFREKKGFFESQRACLGKRGEKLKFGGKLKRLESGYVYASIVKAIEWNGVTYPGNALYLQGFGAIYFGELLLNEYNRRLTMARLEMGCDTEGDGGLTEVDPNGIWG